MARVPEGKKFIFAVLVISEKKADRTTFREAGP
jgi:hypothetical protein